MKNESLLFSLVLVSSFDTEVYSFFIHTYIYIHIHIHTYIYIYIAIGFKAPEFGTSSLLKLVFVDGGNPG